MPCCVNDAWNTRALWLICDQNKLDANVGKRCDSNIVLGAGCGNYSLLKTFSYFICIIQGGPIILQCSKTSLFESIQI